jgi:outer membrane protein OmpA-like peptidoglycan-associated protein
MKSRKKQIHLIGLVLVLALSGAVFGQDGILLNGPSNTSGTDASKTISEEQKQTIEGIVINRNADTFTIRDSRGKETTVAFTAKTKFRLVRKGLFRADRPSDATEIRHGLRLEVEGITNSDGQITARHIRFDEEALRTAQALESRVDPVEDLAKSTQTLAENNQQRIGVVEENAQRISGQVEELSSVANSAVAAAKVAQSTADQAESDATTANARINVLGDYDVLTTIAVHFKNGSARLSPQAMTEIDTVANTVNENLKGWIVAVQGYADATGGTATNRSLSERRAKAVIDYLVTKHGVPPYRVVQPFGFGSSDPVAENNTREGRALNRRAEIMVLVNKGISSQGKTEAASRPQP